METDSALMTDLATLCQSCGLCCDGSLFGRVPLGAGEAEPARRNRLRVLGHGRAFEQPCTALDEHESPSGARRTCSIYDERPVACRSFACRLYDRHRREGGPLEPRLEAVLRVRELVTELQSEGLSAADFDDDPRGASRASDDARRRYAELQRRLEEDFARA